METSNNQLLTYWETNLHATSKSARTIELYRSVLEMFCRHIDDAPLADVTHLEIEEWFAEMRTRGLSQSTMRSRWISLRSFYNWLTDIVELVETSPMAKVKVAKAEPPPVEVIDQTTLVDLLETCNTKTLKGARDHAMIRLMAGSGLRLSEIVGLGVDDVDIATRTASVVGKGDRSRTIRFNPGTADALVKYLLKRGAHRDAHRAELWLGKNGRLTTKGVQQMFADKSTQLGRRLHPHMLRHMFSHTYLANGGNEGDLQTLGGWQSREVMARYGASMRTERALDAYDDVDPLRGL